MYLYKYSCIFLSIFKKKYLEDTELVLPVPFKIEPYPSLLPRTHVMIWRWYQLFCCSSRALIVPQRNENRDNALYICHRNPWNPREPPYLNRRRGKLEGGEKRQQQWSQATVTQRKYKEKPLAKYKYSFLTKKRFYIYKKKRIFLERSLCSEFC